MKNANDSDDWRSLCESASTETDPQKLLDLITKINRALEERNRRSHDARLTTQNDAQLLSEPDAPLDSDFHRAFSQRAEQTGRA